VEELIHQFGIDWKLLLAQVVNFLVLLYVLKRFAYGPIINVLQERRKKIEEGIRASNDAQKRLAQAEEEKKTILLRAEEESVGVVSKAEKIAEDQARIIIIHATEESEHIIENGHKKLEEDRRKLDEEVRLNAEEFIKKGLVLTLRKMNVKDRDQELIKEALNELATIQ
jgi:F-type H+-transporting ATPase subunit b